MNAKIAKRTKEGEEGRNHKGHTKIAKSTKGKKKGLILACGVLLLFSLQVSAQEDARIERLVKELKADKVRKNAVHAIRELEDIGAPAIPNLEQALESPDAQQRQIAAHILRGMPRYAPSQALLRVSVEGLKNDDLPIDKTEMGTWTPPANAAFGAAYLIEHGAQGQDLLKAGLKSQDEQQRLLCAVVLAVGFSGTSKRGERSTYLPFLKAGANSTNEQLRFAAAYVLGCLHVADAAPQAVPILVEHLNGNDIPMDAALSLQALSHFGVPVIPHLAKAAEKADVQGRGCIQGIISHCQWVSTPLPAQYIRRGLQCLWSKHLLAAESVPERVRKEVLLLIGQLGDASAPVRRKAVQRLKEIGRNALPFLREARDCPDPEVRLTVRELLGESPMKGQVLNGAPDLME